MARKRYAIVGLGGRSRMYTRAVTVNFADTCELVGLCDNNPGRLALCNQEFVEAGLPRAPEYAAEDFDKMVAERKPDRIIVTTRDCFHDEYICRAMELGCDAITEKPMTTDETKCQRIVDTVKKTGRNVTVTFNYRYSPPRSQVKELLMEGAIGEILSVDFSWLLNIRHGADYYRRWHRNKVNSGGLMVHKATHHFDLVNWWLSATPAEVFAMGDRRFYRPETAERLGLSGRGERCHECPVADRCAFFLNLAGSEGLKKLYLDCEKYDGYFRDRCVFGADIDIEDTMNLVVRYSTGATMSYCLNSFEPWEGYRVAFNGSKGRLEHQTVETVYISGDGTTPGETIEKGSHIRVFPHHAEPYEVELRTGEGGHGGGDSPLLEDVFGANPPADPLKRSANWVEGAYSVLTGVAANHSMRSGGPVRIADLVTGLPQPDFPEMKGW